jgi:hypothetical protein
MTTTENNHTDHTPRFARRLVGTLSAAAVVCAVAAPIASAKTVTVRKSFKLRADTTTTYKLARNPNAAFADAGYVLRGPDLSVHEDNLVDPYPHQPKNVGQISRDGVSVLDAGIGRTSATPPLEIRVKTGKLAGTFTITLYVVEQS